MSANDAPSGEQRRLAIGTLAIQGSTATSIVAFLAAATVLGRKLSLSEFGVYGLTLSFAMYVAFIQGSVEATAVKAVAEATDEPGRVRAATTTLVVYAALGLGAGVLVAGVGWLLLGVFDIDPSLASEGRRGLLVLAGVIVVGWPLRTFHDMLHGLQRFVAVSLADTFANIAFGVLVVTLALTGAPLWIIIGAGGSASLLSGLASALLARSMGLRIEVRRSSLDADFTRSYIKFSGYVLGTASTDLFIYQLDRAVLGIFRNAATIGLYEAAVRPQALVRTLHGTLSATVLPAASSYAGRGDEVRQRELALRGTRYVLATTVPVATFMIVMAGPLLETWLGQRYVEAQGCLAILLAYWLFGANTGVLGSMMWAHGQARVLAILAWSTAGANLALSLILTPLIGLNGVALGTTGAYALVFPFFLAAATRALGLSIRDLAASAWQPVYPLAACLAGALLALRLALPDGRPIVLLAIGGAGLAAYWAAFYAFSLDRTERAFFRALLSRSSGVA